VQLDAARERPLQVLNGAGGVVLAEDPAGRYLRADEFVFRMSPSGTEPVTFHATSFGQGSGRRGDLDAA